MNCPKCGWPGLIGGTLKRELALAQAGNRIRMEDNAALRAENERLREWLREVSHCDIDGILTLDSGCRYVCHWCGAPSGQPHTAKCEVFLPGGDVR